jgi:hypothetical protein
MNDDGLPDFRFVWPTFDRSFDAFHTLLFWGLGTFFCVGIAVQLLLPDWPPPRRFPLFAIPALIVGLLMTAKRWFSTCHTVDVGPGHIVLKRAGGSTSLPIGEIVGLVAQPGLNWKRVEDVGDEGERLVSWRRLVLLTQSGRHTLPYEAVWCRQIYGALRLVCPVAWGIPYPGNLESPRHDEAGQNADSDQALCRVRRFYRAQAARNAVLGLTLVVGSIVTFVWMIADVFLEKTDELSGQAIIFQTLAIVAGGMFLKDLPRDLRILAQLRREAAKSRI